MARELVRGRTQGWVAGGGTVEGAVDVRLQVLDAHAHGKRLALHGHAVLSQQLKDVARGVAAGKDDAARGHALLGLGAVGGRPGQRHGPHAAAGDV